MDEVERRILNSMKAWQRHSWDIDRGMAYGTADG